MRKKIKIVVIGVVVLLLMLVASPAVTSITTPVKEAIEDFLDENRADLATLDEYFEDAAEAARNSEPIPEPSQQIIKNMDFLVEQWKEIIELHYQQSEPPQEYEGVTAFFESNGTAQFFIDETPPDYEWYKGHCMSFNKTHTDLICFLVLIVGGGVAALVSLLISLIPVLGLIYGFLLGVFIAFFWPVILARLNMIFQAAPYGMALFRFDNVNSSHIWDDKLDIRPQPSYPRPYNPSFHYPQSDWEQIWP